MRFGEMTPTDAEVMHEVLSLFAHRQMIAFLEIGCHRGGTARAVLQWCNDRNIDLLYWGVDNGALGVAEKPFPEANFTLGDSAVVWKDIGYHSFNIVFIDGDHGGNAVILDTIHYGSFVTPGGVMLFHDTAPHIRHTMREATGPDHWWWFNSVNAAHKLMGFPTKEWSLLAEKHDPASKIGGMTAYRKTL